MSIVVNCASETRSPDGDSRRTFSIASTRVAILLLIAQHQIVLRLSDQHLLSGAAADRGLDCILHVGDIDAIARRSLAVDLEGKVGLADDAEQSKIRDAANLAHRH